MGDSGHDREVEDTLATQVGETAELTLDATQTLIRDEHEVDETSANDSTKLLAAHALPRPRTDDQAPARTRFHRGEQLGRYVIVDKLGAGGMGVVFAAYDPDLDRKVALKVLRPGVLRKRSGTEGRSRLLREAQALAKLGHPNVVSIHDAGVHASQVWIAMEFVRGQTLADYFRTAEPSWRETVELMIQAGEGLAAAHAKGLVHRDFKPANVMVDEQGRVRVMDFGLVHVDSDSQTDDGHGPDPSVNPGLALANELTEFGAVIGTPTYMAPEQHRGWSTDARTDQFSFCVTLWLGLHGERPFAGQTLADLALSVTSGSIREPSKAEVPAWLDAAVRRGLAIEPVDRWDTMVELLAALRAGLDQRSPGSPWRWLAAAAALAVVVGGGWGLWALDRRQTVAACEQTGATIGESWTADQRAAAAAAFEATELGFADESWARTAELLDAWVARWSALRIEACVEAELGEQWTPAAYADVEACFELRAAEFAALVDVATQADQSFVPHAVSTAVHLGDPGDCVDPSWLALEPMPDEGEARAQVQTLRSATLRATTLVYIANYDEALRVAEAALAGAEDLGWAPLEAEARYVLASVHNSRSEIDEARALHREAFMQATESGHDLLAARAATSLVGLLSRTAETELALHWAELGRVFLARANVSAPNEHGSLLVNRGVVLMDREDYEAAGAAFTAAIEGFTSELGPDHPDQIVPLINLGIVQRKLERDDLASASFDRAAALARRHLGAHHPMHASALVNVGTIHSAAQRHDQALAIYEQAVGILRRAYGPNDPRLTFALNNRGSVLFRLGRLDEALATHQRVLAIRESLGPAHPNVANSASNIAQTLFALGHLDQALSYAERALAIYTEVYGHDHGRVAGAKYVLATTLAELGRFAEAAPLLREARAIRVEKSGPDHRLSAITEVALARAELELGNHEAAAELLDHALPIVDAEDHESRHGARFDRIRLDARRGRQAEAMAAAEVLVAELRAMDDSADPTGARRRRSPELEAWLSEAARPGRRGR